MALEFLFVSIEYLTVWRRESLVCEKVSKCELSIWTLDGVTVCNRKLIQDVEKRMNEEGHKKTVKWCKNLNFNYRCANAT